MLTKTKKNALLWGLSGAFALTAMAVPFMPHAAAAERPACHCSHADFKTDRAEMLGQMAEKLGVEKQSLADFQAAGNGPRDLHMAILLAKASQKPLADVLHDKTASDSWHDIGKSYGVSPEQLDEARQDLMAQRIADRICGTKQIVKVLLDSGHEPKDVFAAGILARETDRSILNIIDMKNENNNWSDVADSLGVAKDELLAAIRHNDHTMPGGPRDGAKMHEHHHGPQGLHLIVNWDN